MIILQILKAFRVLLKVISLLAGRKPNRFNFSIEPNFIMYIGLNPKINATFFNQTEKEIGIKFGKKLTVCSVC